MLDSREIQISTTSHRLRSRFVRHPRSPEHVAAQEAVEVDYKGHRAKRKTPKFATALLLNDPCP